MFREALLGLIVISSTNVFAAETVAGVKADVAKIQADSDKCFQEAVSNYEMGACSSEKLKAGDALLNRVYKAQVAVLKQEISEEKEAGPLGQIGEETLKRLVKAQKAWIAFRDAECDLAGTTMLFGSGEGLEITSCHAETTIERAIKLAEFFNSSSDPK